MTKDFSLSNMEIKNLYIFLKKGFSCVLEFTKHRFIHGVYKIKS